MLRIAPYIYFFLLTILLPAGVSSQNLVRYASSVDGIDADNVAVYIEDLRNSAVVLDVNGEIPMTPASVTKVLTAATAFRRLNIDDCFLTEVEAQGAIKDSVLVGNIVVHASGDPTIESAYFPEKLGVADSIAEAVLRAGINRIEGTIVIDTPQWLDSAPPEGWKDNDLMWPYGAGHHALNYADNRFGVRLSRDGSYVITPPTPGVKIKRSSSNRGEEGVRRQVDDSGLTTYYIYHKGRKPVYKQLANPNPDSTFVAALQRALSQRGVSVNGRRELKHSKRSTPIYLHSSPTFYDIMRSMIMRSDNQMAEAILRRTWPGMSREDAAKAELDFWLDLGVTVDGVTIEDGSGLSRNDRIPAYALADLLVWMADNDDNFFRFLDMFPRAGVSGTMRSYLKETPLQDCFVAKTGSLNGVQCYAGYLLDAMGMPSHVVVIMINGFKGSRSELKSTLRDLLIEKLL